MWLNDAFLSFSRFSWFGFIAIGLLREHKGAGRDAPATMGCLLRVGMSVPAHPQALGLGQRLDANNVWLCDTTCAGKSEDEAKTQMVAGRCGIHLFRIDIVGLR